MAPQAARFHQEANRYHELARDATTDRMRSHLLRLAHHYRSIAEGLEPFPDADEPLPLESAVLSFRAAPPAACAGAKPRRTADVGRPPKDAAAGGERAIPEQHAVPEQRIRERAYAIWERAGRPHGNDRDHWRQAERELAAGDPDSV